MKDKKKEDKMKGDGKGKEELKGYREENYDKLMKRIRGYSKD